MSQQKFDLSDKTLYQGRGRYLALIPASIIFTVVGVFMLGDSDIFIRMIAVVSIVFFGVLGLPVMIYRLVKPGSITLDSDGFEIPTIRKNKPSRTKWTEVEAFEVMKMGGNKMVNIIYNDTYKKYATARSAVKYFAGAEAALENYGGLNAEQMAEMMEAYRKKYGTKKQG